MSLKKFLIIRKKAQASIEYLILAVVILGLMLLSVNTFFPNLKKSLDENFFFKAVLKILDDGVVTIPPGPGPGPEPPPPEPM